MGQIKDRLAGNPAGLETAVTGTAGALADASEAFGAVETKLLLAAAGVVAIILLLTYASMVLSFAAAMGVVGFVCQAIGYPDLSPSMPLYGYLFLVTLGVDYTIFLMTRAREEVTVVGNRAGVLDALAVTGGVITSAGIVLAATFATLLVLPVVAALHIGLIVAVGVLLDTFVVRTLLIPAFAVDLGRWVWWPSRLARQAAPIDPPSRSAVELVA